MDRLWSPWRMAYIEANKAEPADRSCVFCTLLEESRARSLEQTLVPA